MRERPREGGEKKRPLGHKVLFHSGLSLGSAPICSTGTLSSLQARPSLRGQQLADRSALLGGAGFCALFSPCPRTGGAARSLTPAESRAEVSKGSESLQATAALGLLLSPDKPRHGERRFITFFFFFFHLLLLIPGRLSPGRFLHICKCKVAASGKTFS